MRRSKLELYGDIIGALSKKNLCIDDLAFECCMNCILLQARLNFLVGHDIVSMDVSHNSRAIYFLTRRGLAISKTLVIAKRLEKLQAS